MKRLFLALAALLVAQLAHAAVNLNTASKDELVALPGIGPSKAQAILDYRHQHGPFRAVDDVRKVKGIGEKLFLQIKPELTVTGGAAPKPAAGTPPTAKADTRGDAKGAPIAVRAATGTVARDDKAKK
jgi:competence protein ComEA